ncbi:MAG: hypothetical protein N2Z67_05860 [Acetobacteraceae bacterium]|nr:hypothetical protein [Acetobacteraceae bacterium]
MTNRKTLLAGLGLAALLGAPAAAQVPIGSLTPGGVAIQGTVTDVFGNRFVLQDQSGRMLVDGGGPRHQRLDIRSGERLTVTGRLEENGFRAESIRREDGREIAIARPAGPPPRAAGTPDRRGPSRHAAVIAPEAAVRAAEAAGYRVQGSPERHPRHYEMAALNPRGERVQVHVDFEGRVYRETWDRGRGFGGRPEEAEARRMAEAAGYRLTGPMEARPRHWEAEALRADGQRVRLHVHAEGLRRVETVR